MKNVLKSAILGKSAHCLDAPFLNARRILTRTRTILSQGTRVEVGEPEAMMYGGSEVLAVPYRSNGNQGYLLAQEV